MSIFKTKNNIFTAKFWKYQNAANHIRMLEGYKIYLSKLKQENPSIDFVLNENIFLLLGVEHLIDKTNKTTGLYYPIINNKIPWEHQSEIDFIPKEAKVYYDKLWELKVFW